MLRDSQIRNSQSEIRNPNAILFSSFLALALILILSLAGCDKSGRAPAKPAPSTASSNIVNLYAPCGIVKPFKALKEALKAQPNPIQLNDVYDNATILVKRIENKGERPDLLVSPGRLEIEGLIKKGFIAADDVKAFGQHEIVLFVPRKNPAGIKTLEDIKSDKVKKVALPDPDVNSVGLRTRESLRKLGLWKDIEKKIVKFDHPIAAYTNVSRGKSEASFAYRLCPLESAPDKIKYSRVKIIAPLPRGSHGPAQLLISILSTSKRKSLAKRVVDFMLSDEGLKLLEENGVPIIKKPANVTVFVPCSMIFTINAVKVAFEGKNPDIKLKMTYDKAMNLMKRINKGGERPDIFMSPGTREMDRLTEKGFIDASTRKVFGRFELVLFVRKSLTKPIKSIADLKEDTVKTISIASPDQNSVGLCTKQALTKLALWASLKDKIKIARSPKESYILVTGGKMDAGFAYAGCPLPKGPDMLRASKIRIVEAAPPDSYNASDAVAAILANSKQKAEAQKFIDYMLSEEGQKILGEQGIPNKNDQ